MSIKSPVSPACKHQNCEDCETFGCSHTCHSALDDPGPEIEESFNRFSDDDDAIGLELGDIDDS